MRHTQLAYSIACGQQAPTQLLQRTQYSPPQTAQSPSHSLDAVVWAQKPRHQYVVCQTRAVVDVGVNTPPMHREASPHSNIAQQPSCEADGGAAMRPRIFHLATAVALLQFALTSALDATRPVVVAWHAKARCATGLCATHSAEPTAITILRASHAACTATTFEGRG